MTTPIIRLTNEGTRDATLVGMPGNQSSVIVKLGIDDGAGLGITEYEAPAGYAPPPLLHRHTREGAGFYVISGELGFAFDEREPVLAGPGSLIWLPSQTWFRWGVTGDAPAKFLGLFLPAGFENFFAMADEAIRREAENGEPDRETIRRVLAQVRDGFGDEYKPQSGSVPPQS